METPLSTPATSVLFPDASSYCLGNTLESIGNSVQDKEAVENIDHGNIEALLGVFEDDLLDKAIFYKQLFGYSKKITGDYQLAEDAVADFYCNTVRKVKHGVLPYKYPVDRKKGIEGNPEIRPWAFTCVNNTCKDLLRRNKKHRKMARLGINTSNNLDFDGNECLDYAIPEDPSTFPLELMEREETRKQVRTHLEKLPVKFRMPILLAYFGDYEYKEAAEILEIPVGTLKSRMHCGLKYLERIIKTSGETA